MQWKNNKRTFWNIFFNADWRLSCLYFVSPRERQWRQRVFLGKTLVIARATCVFSLGFKKEHREWRNNEYVLLQHVYFGALSDVTVVLGMRQSIVPYPSLMFRKPTVCFFNLAILLIWQYCYQQRSQSSGHFWISGHFVQKVLYNGIGKNGFSGNVLLFQDLFMIVTDGISVPSNQKIVTQRIITPISVLKWKDFVSGTFTAGVCFLY